MIVQTMKLTGMSLRSLNARLGTSSIIVVGIGGVVAVLVGLLAMSKGLQGALEETGRPDRALVLRTGATNEITSWLTMDELAIVSELEGIDMASGELFVVADLITRDTGQPGVAIARGVGDSAFRIRPELTVTQGRKFEPGRNEVVAGVGAVANYAGLAVGDQLRIRDDVWTVVGHFRGAGAHDSEIWMDLPVAQAAFRRGGAVSSVRVRLTDQHAGAALASRLGDDPRLRAHLVPETRFYHEQSRERTRLMESFAYLIAGIMAVGAIISAYSSMHAAVGIRAVEIATLRALGFQGTPIVTSVLLESLLLAACGGLLGGGLVYLIYDGYAASTLDSGSLSAVAFEFAVTPDLVVGGVSCALLLGLVGGLVPAVSAVRTGIADALRGD